MHWLVGRLVRSAFAFRHLPGKFASLPLTYTRRIFLILGIHPAYLKRTVRQKERNRERQRERQRERKKKRKKERKRERKKQRKKGRAKERKAERN